MDAILILAMAGTVAIGLITDCIEKRSDKRWEHDDERTALRERIRELEAENEILRHRVTAKTGHACYIRDCKIDDLRGENERLQRMNSTYRAQLRRAAND